MATAYDRQREANIAANAALLAVLELTGPGGASLNLSPRKAPTRCKGKFSTPTSKKRKATDGEESAPKSQRRASVSASPAPSTGTRRSTRMAGKTVDYTAQSVKLYREVGSPSARGGGQFVVGDDEKEGEQRGSGFGVTVGERLHNPKKFGAIPGVPVGTWWKTRIECSRAAVHAPTVAGISGNAEQGAWSIALSGGYPDDVDNGNSFTYTGCGGRDLKGTKQNPKNLRTAPQTFDQSFDNPLNAALKRSHETGKPVRVIRGFKLPSKWAPADGYRYDGLYTVKKAWLATGLTKGLKVCRYAFVRMPGQDPVVLTSGEEGSSALDGEAEAEAEAEAESGAEGSEKENKDDEEAEKKMPEPAEPAKEAEAEKDEEVAAVEDDEAQVAAAVAEGDAVLEVEGDAECGMRMC